MTLLSRKADYALLILSHLHRHSDGSNARAIAERYGLSRPFVANILKDLCHKGFVTSHRGVKGGYVLRQSANQVPLAELLEAIDERFQLMQCAHPAGVADTCAVEQTCLVKGPLTEIHRRMVEVLRGVTLAELFEPTGHPVSVAVGLLPMLPTARCGSSADCRHPEPTTACQEPTPTWP